eukprot:s1834_g11.t1
MENHAFCLSDRMRGTLQVTDRVPMDPWLIGHFCNNLQRGLHDCQRIASVSSDSNPWSALTCTVKSSARARTATVGLQRFVGLRMQSVLEWLWPSCQPLTARSEPRRHSQSHEGLQEPSVLQQLSAPQPMPPERRGGSCTGSERSLTPPPASPAPALAELGYRPGASRLSPDTGGRPPQVPQLPLRPVPELPTPVEQWRAPMEPQFDVPRPLPFPEVGKPLKHWDISAMAGPEPPSPQMSQADLPQRPTTQPPMGDLRPTDGRGGSRSIAPVGVEAELVEQLLHRFVLEHKAPTLQRRERAAYKEMLEQVSWTALEPKAAHDAALLLGKHFLAPVSANEALRAFRRCLHTILCDERVLDIVEHQMTLHFSRLKPKNTSEMVEN